MRFWGTVCCVLCVVSAGHAARWREVRTTQGAVRGYLRSPPAHYAYLGVPYAARPPRHDRFGPPRPPTRRSGIFEATHRVRCPQPGGGRPDENCLVVNVFAPEEAHGLPVVVHVHDGRFVKGSGTHAAAPRLLRENFVLVTFNYRLGAAGFLCLGVKEAKGNMGLKDQVAALYWVHKNIRNFGGNPAQVTLYGTGTGATSVHLLLLSKSTEGLVHRVILESGSAISEHTMSYNPIGAAKDGVKLLKSSNTDSLSISTLLKEYKLANVSSLVKVSKLDEKFSRESRFLPCLENDYYFSPSVLSEDPFILLEKKEYHSIPMLFIYTNGEDLLRMSNLTDLRGCLEEFLPQNLQFPNISVTNKVVQVLDNLYFKDSINKPLPQSFIKYFVDITVYPIIKSALLHAKKGLGNIYLMEFTYEGGLNNLYKFKEVNGAQRGDVLNYINAAEEVHGDDDLTAGRLISMWTNFAKYGDPTPLTTQAIPVIWEPINKLIEDLIQMKILHFGNKLQMKKPSSMNRMLLWDKIYDNFYKRHTIPLTEDEQI